MSTSHCDRIREERTRLGLNQEDFGKLGGVSKRTQMYYEKGERSPDLEYLLGLGAAGVDVWYIVLGQRAGISFDGDRLITEQKSVSVRDTENAPPSEHIAAPTEERRKIKHSENVHQLDSLSIPVVSREEVCSMIIDILHTKRRTLPSSTVWAIVDSIMALQRAGASVDKSTIDVQLQLVK